MRDRAVLVLALLLTLGACGPSPVEKAQRTRDEAATTGIRREQEARWQARLRAETTPAEQEACRASGGAFRPVGARGVPLCAIPYTDAGRACRDKGDCQGRCWADDGIERPKQGAPVKGRCEQDQYGASGRCGVEVVEGKAVYWPCAD